MNVFDKMAENAGLDPREAEVKLDLRGMQEGAALEKLGHVVHYCRKTSAASLFVTFDAARPGGGETLFQPLARYFRKEKDGGRVLRAVPVMTEGSSGLFVNFRI